MTTIKAFTLLGTILAFSSPFSYAQERIISAGGSVTELIYALDAQKSLVAVDVTSHLPQGQVLPKVGYHRQLSAEGLISLKPTRLIGSDEMGPESTLRLLKQSGVSVDIINTEATVAGLLKRVDQLAEVTHSEDRSAQLKEEINQTVASLQANQPQTQDKKKVLFLLIHEGRPANVAGSETTPDEIITLAGAVNPAAEQLNAYKPLAMESLVKMQPDAVIVSQRSADKFGDIDAVIAAVPMLAATPAGKNRAVMTINGSALIGGLGLLSLDEAKRLNKFLYQ
ncbi:heme/hemin ABC transporter substrate-binding protein [Psychromonas aquimarina]|uniref:heme/hemin ABC transporter substrate-binding protein n=1 Tax=Psychromonas aquimarina TaxID=444919 RepID=UPI000409D302|nr:hemin ABC transporter substrate-binding protein [Psychromonas aquimarina]